MDDLPSNCFSLLMAPGDGSIASLGGVVLLKLTIVLLLVAANGFFVAAEFALVGVRPSRI